MHASTYQCGFFPAASEQYQLLVNPGADSSLMLLSLICMHVQFVDWKVMGGSFFLAAAGLVGKWVVARWSIQLSNYLSPDLARLYGWCSSLVQKSQSTDLIGKILSHKISSNFLSQHVNSRVWKLYSQRQNWASQHIFSLLPPPLIRLPLFSINNGSDSYCWCGTCFDQGTRTKRGQDSPLDVRKAHRYHAWAIYSKSR